MGLLYGRAGRLTAENGGFRPWQWQGRALASLDGLASGSAISAAVVRQTPPFKTKCGAGLALHPSNGLTPS
jgi:hypothetical protein